MMLLLIFLWIVATSCSAQKQTVFPDTQVVIPLSGVEGPQWNLSSSDGVYANISGHVPGDVLSDLLKAGIIDDPYWERNFLTQRRVWMGRPAADDPRLVSSSNHSALLERRTRTWVYSTEFELDLVHHQEDDGNSNKDTYLLVIEGIKMGASIAVNGVVLGNVTDQFLRVQFALNDDVLGRGSSSMQKDASSPFRRALSSTLQTKHELTITFDPAIPTEGRYMAASGGWDWAPYSRAGDERGSRVFSFGIVEPIYIVKQHFASVTHVVPKIYYQGPYAREPLFNGPEGDFQVDIYIHLECHGSRLNSPKAGVVVVRNDFENATAVSEEKVTVRFNDSKLVKVSLTASKKVVKLWWPNGLGDQTLYNINVAFRSENYQTEWIHKRIGFRTCALVTVNDTDDLLVNDMIQTKSEGSGTHGMFFRVNGAPIWSRGANVVPMDQLEGRLTDRAHRIMVESAAKANMNMLRVWGGGMILPNSFYEACDEYGILLYHDMMFVEEQHHGPKRSQVVEDEIRFMVRELSVHPSIVLWSGCNECTVSMGSASEIYATFVMQTVAQEDDTRPIWPSCPAAVGWHSGVYSMDGRPSGSQLSTSNRTKGQPPLEVHGPYQRAFSLSFPSVNGFANNWTYNTNIPAHIGNAPVGIKFQSHFVSEFGASTFPSFESLSATLCPQHWSVHGGSQPDSCHHVVGNENSCVGTNVMAERNYACDSHILAYFGETDLKMVGRLEFRKQLHRCTMAHTLWMKGQIEALRSTNSFGTMIWQLNENWSTGGWGLLEYGPMAGLKGQVLGGRWTPLMYLLKTALYRDVFASCGVMSKQQYTCFCRNDSLKNFIGRLHITSLNLETGLTTPVATHCVDIAGGSLQILDAATYPPGDNEVYVLSVTDYNGKTMIGEYVLLGKAPRYLTALASGNVTINIVSIEENEAGDALLALRSNGVALYVVLTTAIEGHFEENAFLLKPSNETSKVVKFVPLTPPVDIDSLKRSLSIEHLASYG